MPATRPFSAVYRHPARGSTPAVSCGITGPHSGPQGTAAPAPRMPQPRRSAVRPYNAPEFRKRVPVPDLSLRPSESFLCPPRGNPGLWGIGVGTRNRAKPEKQARREPGSPRPRGKSNQNPKSPSPPLKVGESRPKYGKPLKKWARFFGEPGECVVEPTNQPTNQPTNRCCCLRFCVFRSEQPKSLCFYLRPSVGALFVLIIHVCCSSFCVSRNIQIVYFRNDPPITSSSSS